MTDPQLLNNNNNQNNDTGSNNTYNNNNNKNHSNYEGESRYRHKKFTKMASVGHIINVVVQNTKASLELGNDNINEANETRKLGYICPYCKISCAKPSVLQKHIRAHTNERPYPCVPCGFAFKTKSNLYKHCRSRAHTLKMEGAETSKILQVSSQLSEDSEASFSDSASTGTNTPPPLQFLPLSFSYNLDTDVNFGSNVSAKVENSPKIYKPKFHMVLQDNIRSKQSYNEMPNTNQLHEQIEHIINDNQNSIEEFDPTIHELLHHQHSFVELVNYEPELSRKRYYSESMTTNLKSDEKSDGHIISSPEKSRGPLLGNTRLVEVAKQPRLEKELLQSVQPNSLQMFGGEVKIIDSNGKRKIMRIDSSSNSTQELKFLDCASQNPNTASIVVRSSLHSGGTMLHNIMIPTSQIKENNLITSTFNLSSIAPNISTPNFAPRVSCLNSLKQPEKIFHAGRIIPYVPGIPGPENLSLPLLSVDTQHIKEVSKSVDIDHVKKLENLNSHNSIHEINNSSKFLRPSSLSLKPGTFTPKKHHGITPNAYTLALISPETPRPKKSYGQLYLNGHAYTYLGLKCSTKLFYCTLNRPQPMYVKQQDGLSMYSNWKICKEALPLLQLGLYDSRHRPSGYTLAHTRSADILTHSSNQQNTPSSPDSGLECDSQKKSKRNVLKLSFGGFESNEDYIYVRGRGRGRYICEECGIRCKKPSMLKKHFRTHTDLRPYTCKYCAFSFKTKGNLTKHMKSKTHYKKCTDLMILPVPTSIEENNIDKDVLNRLTTSGINIEEISSSEEESEHEEEIESDVSSCEEHEAAKGLLQLSRPYLPGLLSITRPATYPYSQSIVAYKLNTQTNNHMHDTYPRISVIQSCKVMDESILAKPIDLTTKQIDLNPENEIKSQTSSESQLKQCYDNVTQCTHSNNTVSLVSSSSLFQSIMETMGGIPTQNNNWCTDLADGRMLQAYLTERHLMDSKLKQQCQITLISKDHNNDLHMASASPCLTREQVTSIPFTKESRQCLDIPNDIEQTPNLLYEQTKIQSNKDLHKKKFDLDIRTCTVVKQQVQSINQNTILTNTETKLKSFTNMLQSKISNELELFQPSINNTINYISMTENTHNVCNICNKVFNKPSQLKLHINIHYFERPFKCDSCGTSFRTKGHLTKHERSSLHHNKMSMTSTFGAATSSNPRPFKCTDCKSAFRIHGHLAKHLRSKMHIMKLECLRKLPFGTYAEVERSGMNLNDIDTTDCDTSLASLQIIAQKLGNKYLNKFGQLEIERISDQIVSNSDNSSDEGETKTSKLKSENNNPIVSGNCTNVGYNSNNLNCINIQVNNIVRRSNYKCEFCSLQVKSINELHLHCLMVHKIEVESNSVIAVLSEKKKDTNGNKNSCSYERTDIFSDKIQSETDVI